MVPGPGLQPSPEPLAADGAGAGRGGGGAARAGARERAEARPARRGPQRPLASAGRKQHYGNMAAPQCTPGGRRAEELAGGGRAPEIPGARPGPAARATGTGAQTRFPPGEKAEDPHGRNVAGRPP